MNKITPVRRRLNFLYITVILFFTVFIFFIACKKDDSKATVATTSNSTLILANKYSAAELFRGLVLADGEVAYKIPKLNEIHKIVSKFNTDSKNKAALNLYENNLISFIQTNYPGYLERFKTEIVSGDLIRIDSGMYAAVDIAMQSMALYGIVSQLDPSKANSMIRVAINQNEFKFNAFIQDLKEDKIASSEIGKRATEVFGKDFSRIRYVLKKSNNAPVGADCLFLNFVAAVNIFIYLNAAGAVNVAVAVNAAAAVNAAIAVNFAVTFSKETKSVIQNPGEKLDREEFILQIADNL